MKDSLSYAEYVADGRTKEKEEILNFIVNSSKDCDHVVFLGDQFNSKNNSSEVVRSFVEFVERFENKNVYIICGNHERRSSGKTAIDFLKEVRGKENWNIITEYKSFKIEDKKIDFMPFITKAELGVSSNEDGRDEIMSRLTSGDILFHHYSVADTVAANGISTNTFNEVVLPKRDLEKKYSWVIGGHIHTPAQYGATVVAGSVFTNEVGEGQKYIWKVELNDMSISKLPLPGRKIIKIENPTVGELSSMDKHDIVKILVTSKDVDTEKIREEMHKFDAHIYVEQLPNERKKIDIEDSAIDFSIENLLKLYADERAIDINKLIKGYDLIKQ